MSAHALYVAAAYGITVVVLGALFGAILADQQARRRELLELEQQGMRRRSDREAAH